MRFVMLSLAVVTAVIYGCNRRDTVANLFGNAENVRTVTSATRVDAYRVDDPGNRPDATKIANAAIITGPLQINVEDARSLGLILANSQTYNVNAVKTCVFHPDVAFRFFRNDRTVDVVLCVTCSEFEVYSDDRRLGKEDFDHESSSLRRIAASLFPDLGAPSSQK